MDHSYQRALILHQQRRFADAEIELNQSLASDPHNAHAHAMLGLCLAERKDWERASEEADTAVGLAPDLAFAHYVRAKVLSERNRVEEAGAAITEALRLDSYNPAYYALQGGIRFQQRRWQDSLDSSEHGLSIDPTHPACVNLRAMALVQLGRKTEAGTAIREALANDPHNAVTHANQGWTLLHQGQHKQALEHFREALRLDPELDWARAGMVEALKARHLVYRLMLRYFLWMSRLGRGVQWGIIIGLYVGFQMLGGAVRTNPKWAPFIWPLLIAYIAFAYLTWIASPLFNLLLRLNRFGRYALSKEQRITSNWIGGAFLAAIACLIVYSVTRRIEALFSAAYCMLMVLALAGMFRAPVGWPRTIMMLYTIGVAAVGATALVLVHTASSQADVDHAKNLATAFLWGIFLQGWIANALAAARVKR
jgi:tetratricopeptide (TPR) repeat protein